MTNFVPDRFEIIRTIREDHRSKTFLVNDNLTDLSGVVLRIVKKDHVRLDRSQLVKHFSWLIGVRHSQLATVFDAGLTTHSHLYYVREYLPPSDLLSVDPINAMKALMAVACFLVANGRTHGAIKPSNVFATRDHLKLADAGLPGPGFCEDEESVHCSAPEVLQGANLSVEADLYSVGAVFYRLLTGRHLFDDIDLNRLRSKYVSAAAQAAACSSPVSPRILDRVLQLLSKNPGDRMTAFESLRQAIEVELIAASRGIFVGRERPLQQAVGIGQKPAKSLQVVLVEGQPGIGKSRFIAEMKLHCALSGLVFAIWQCRRNSTDLAPILDGLGKLLKACPVGPQSQSKSGFDPITATALEYPSSSGAQEEAACPLEKTASDLLRIIVAIAKRKPLVLAIEDIELADSGTILLLEQLSFRAAEIPMTVVLTTQIVEVDSELVGTIMACLGRSFVRLHLEALTEEESIRLAQLLEHDREIQLRTLQVAGGNPLFIESYSKCLARSSDLTPEPVSEACQSTLSTLTKRTRSFLQMLSVFCWPVDLKILPSLLGKDVPDLNSRLDIVLRLGLIKLSAETVGIPSPVLRARLYASIPKQLKETLNRAAFLALRDLDNRNEFLAHYAFEGALFAEAGSRYLLLANAACRLQNYRAARVQFERAKQCLDRSGQSLAPDEVLSLAQCYQWAGKQRLARRLYMELLSVELVQKNHELLSTVYGRLATTFDRTPVKERLQFLESAINCLPKNSALLPRRYAQLCTALLRVGDLTRAKEVHERAEEYTMQEKKDPALLIPMRATLLQVFGDFRRAIECYLLCTVDAEMAVVLNNVAVCFENLGDLKTAIEYQLRCRQLAITNGTIPIQILSLGNLAAIKTKLGEMREAANLFHQAREEIKRLLNAADTFDKSRFCFAIDADAALHAAYSGDYKLAGHHVKNNRIVPGSVFEIDRMFCALVRCKFFLKVGLMKNVGELLRRFDNTSIFKIDFFRVERALLESELSDNPAKHKSEQLEHALVLSNNLGTLYQQCELLNALAGVYLELAEKEKAEDYSMKALRLANENGYRLLAARALLLTAIAARKQRDQQHRLSDALQLASEIGLPELVAEASYHIGMLNLERGNMVTAREYLIRSTSITANLAEGVPIAGRPKYLGVKWRREARQALSRCNDAIPLNSLGTPNPESDKYFPAIYRLTMSVTAANSVERVMAAIQETLTRALSRAAVITVKHQTASYNLAIRTKLASPLMDRIQLIQTRNKDHVYFDAADDRGARQATAWIPLTSETCEGGIYVVSRPYEQPFSEKEIELLTMIGAIASGALKKIETRNTEGLDAKDLSEFHGMIGASKAIQQVYSHIDIAARNAATVVIEGESGTGKELVAKAIHAAGPRAKEAFIAVDCGAIPEALIEAELFGAKRGAYTGAVADRPGLFEAAHRGTIFLDEISNTTPALQAKLLRVIQEREVRRIGETKGRPIDVRLIVASNQSLEALAGSGRFRKDLLFRLKVLYIEVPPLRNRRDDIPMLTHAFVQKLNTSNKTKKYFAPGIVNQLLTQTFPGNVRELQNAIERAFFSTKGNMIAQVPLDALVEADEVQSWFRDLSEGRKDFWSTIHNRYKRRDISREKVLALVDFGLRSTRGNYKTMASLFHLPEKDYRRFMDFLRRNECLLDFRPYRKPADSRED